MPGINHLKDVYNEKGMDFIKNLFSKHVYVSEKIDGSRFAFKRIESELIFYKRDANTPINMVDRIVMSYYETGISHIESLQIGTIPENITFGFEYFANSNPGSIVYDKTPKNSLILTDITENGKLSTNLDELITYSNLFKVSPPPIIYNGRLNDTQIEQLTEFLSAPWEELYSKFKTQSFTTYIISILNPKLKNTALNIGISKPIEGIVFSFDNGDHFINTKVVDPLYTQKAREIAKGRFTPQVKEDNSKLKWIMKDMISFIKTDATFDIKYKSDISDMKYIELLCTIFHKYYILNYSKFKTMPTKKGDTILQLDVNYDLISPARLRILLKSDNRVKMVFKTFMASFGKVRKRGNRVLDKQMVTDVNFYISRFKELTESTQNVDLKMDTILTKIVKLTKPQ